MRVQTATIAETVRTRGKAWAQIRHKVMMRDAGLCQPSLRHGMLVQATEVDHIVPLVRGGADDERNLQAIGPAAHKAKSAAEVRGEVWDEAAWAAAAQQIHG